MNDEYTACKTELKADPNSGVTRDHERIPQK